MRQNRVEILATLIDNGGKPYDFGTSPHDNQKFQFSVVFKHNLHLFSERIGFIFVELLVCPHYRDEFFRFA